MTANPASVSVLALALAGCLSLLGAAGAALAQQHQAASTAVTQPIDLDIAAQPLDLALDRYAAVSHRPVLFSSELVAGLVSSAVRGRHLPEAALNLLLRGTGLVAEKGQGGPADAFVLVQAEGAYAGIDGLVRDPRYPGQAQARIWQALCDNPVTAPGAYRALLRFQLDVAGHVQAVRLIASTGNARRDAAVVDTLRAVQVGAPPPEMAQQPLTMLIMPGDQPGMPRCAKATG
ncbi:TonB family protein [Variovorax boronicumulans]